MGAVAPDRPRRRRADRRRHPAADRQPRDEAAARGDQREPRGPDARGADRAQRQLVVGREGGQDRLLRRARGALRRLRRRPAGARPRATARPDPSRGPAAAPRVARAAGRRRRAGCRRRGPPAGAQRMDVGASARAGHLRSRRRTRGGLGHLPGHHPGPRHRGPAAGPGDPELPHAGGRHRRERGDHARRGAQPGPLTRRPARRLGPRPRLRALRRRLGADTAPRGGGAGGVARCGRRRGRRHRAGDRRGVLPPRRVRLGRRAPTHARLRHPPAGRDPGGDHHHLTAAAVPARHDPGDGRGRRGPALPGRGSRAGRAAAGRRARPRRAGIAAQVRLPGHHEPRDPDAAQRHRRPQRAARCHHAVRPAAAPGVRDRGVEPVTAGPDQRHPRLLQDRGRPAGGRVGRLRGA